VAKIPMMNSMTSAYRGAVAQTLSLEDSVVKERLDYELEVIKIKGTAKYFLVVGDLLREARERGILTTIRGSVPDHSLPMYLVLPM
jgi:DNA polymerase III alpha subunit